MSGRSVMKKVGGILVGLLAVPIVACLFAAGQAAPSVSGPEGRIGADPADLQHVKRILSGLVAGRDEDRL